MKTKVYPTHKNSLAIKHPIDGPLQAEGSMWEMDGFTCRMLADHAVSGTPPTKVEAAVAEKMTPKT